MSTEPLSGSEVRRLRSAHCRIERPAGDGHMCAVCKWRWPCVVRRLLDMLGERDGR